MLAQVHKNDHKKGGTKVAMRNRFFSGLIAGAVVGIVAGLLLAPKPGKETRHIVGTRAGELQAVGPGLLRQSCQGLRSHLRPLPLPGNRPLPPRSLGVVADRILDRPLP